MLASGIIVFREVLEAAIVIGIVLAATRGLRGRDFWVIAGIVAGLAGAAIVALFTEAISTSLSGMGQEILNAGILFTAAAVLAWSVVWMKSYGQQLAAHINAVGHEVSKGSLPMHMLAVVVGLAVLREGAETVLFLYGIAAVPGSESTLMLAGAMLGLAGGVGVGLVMYLGLIKIPARHLFTVTSWLLAFLAAGMASQGADYLAAAGHLPPLVNVAWDTSAILSERNVVGQVLHTLIGYDSRPSGIQLVFYAATLAAIAVLMTLGEKRMAKKATLAVAAIAFAAAGLPAGDAGAHHKVYSPIVEGGELGLEWRGHHDFDDEDAKDHLQRQRYEVEYGVTDRWMVALFGEARKTSTRGYHYDATAVETIYQLFEQGERWLDAGLYFEYKVADRNSDPDKAEFKLLLEKSFPRYQHTANLILEKEVGNNADDNTEFEYAWSSRYRLSPLLMPGVEFHGKLGEISNTKSPEDQTHQAGPVFYGKIPLSALGAKIKYEAGYLFGLTDASPDGTFKWLLEYEFRF